MLERSDLEPLFFAPFVSSIMRVEPAWIDYNGHLNMAYYNVLFDRAVDEAYELLGIGLDYVKKRRHSLYTAEVHVRYLRELHAGDPVRVDVPAARLRQEAAALFRAIGARDRRLPVGDVGKPCHPCRHGRQARARRCRRACSIGWKRWRPRMHACRAHKRPGAASE